MTTNASDTNRIELVGTVADVQHKTTASGKSFIVVNVEVRRTWVDCDGHKQERLETIPCYELAPLVAGGRRQSAGRGPAVVAVLHWARRRGVTAGD